MYTHIYIYIHNISYFYSFFLFPPKKTKGNCGGAHFPLKHFTFTHRCHQAEFRLLPGVAWIFWMGVVFPTRQMIISTCKYSPEN